MTVLGVDVSNVGQGKIDWTAAKPHVIFGIAKASQGRGFTDPELAANLAGMKVRGIVRGAYHFLDGTAGAQQCDHFLAAVGDPHGVLLALDVEMRGCGGQVAAFLTHFEARMPGRKILVYSNRGLWGSVGAPADVTRFPVVGWHAGSVNGAYTSARGTLAAEWAATTVHTTPFGGISHFPLIQFTDHAGVPGMTGGIDGDAWIAPAADLMALTGITPIPPPPSPVPSIFEETPMYVATTSAAPATTRINPVTGVSETVAEVAAGAVFEVGPGVRFWIGGRAWKAIGDAYAAANIPVVLAHMAGPDIQSNYPVLLGAGD